MGLFSRKRIPNLNSLRDEVLGELRGLVTDFGQVFPAELRFRGILERAPQLVEAQLPRLEEFAALDLEREVTDPMEQEDVLAALSGAQHLPQMMHSFAKVLEEEKKDRSLQALLDSAGEVAVRLDGLIHLWVLKNGGLEALLGDL
jgi:hypothetical protein